MTIRPKSNGGTPITAENCACKIERFRSMTHEKTVAVNGLALAVLGCLMLLIGGCSSAKITNTWRDPKFAGPIQFKKTVALAIHPDTTVRRVAEDEMVRQ